MSSGMVVDLFSEDRAHAALVVALMRRVGREENVEMVVRRRSSTGGHSFAVREFKRYQQVSESGVLSSKQADVVVVGIDGNCSTFAEARERIRGEAMPTFVDRLVVACPDPHIERWYMADPASFGNVVGHQPTVGPEKCARDHYKQILGRAVSQGRHPPNVSGHDLAVELAEAMDLFRAGKNVPSLKAFLDDLRTALRRIRLASNPGNGT